MRGYSHRDDSLIYMRDSRAQVAAFIRAAEEGLRPPPFDPKKPATGLALRLFKISNAANFREIT